MKNSSPFLDWLIKNGKESIFFILTWSIGWYLFSGVIGEISTNNDTLSTKQWTLFFTSLFLLLLPFVSSISLGTLLKVERELKNSIKELRKAQEEYTQQLQELTSRLK